MNPLKSLLASLVVVAGGMSVSSAHGADPGPTDAFLDRPLPADLHIGTVSAPAPEGNGSTMKEFSMLRVPSFWGGVQLLGAMSGKTVRLPKELAEWPDERTEDNWGMSLGIPQDGKVRELFERLCHTLDLDWHYDAKADVIDLEPQWKRADARPGRELVGILLDTRPVRPHELKHDPKPNRVGGHGSLLDPWRLAFDALLSQPENFASAGAMRLYHDSHGHGRGMSLYLVDNLCAGRLLAPDGQVQVLVLNEQESWSNKEDPGNLAYYLFDENGKFTQGGVYAIAPGRGGGIIKARIEDKQIVTVTVGWGSFASNPVDLHFALSDGKLVLQGTTDSNGVERNAKDSQHLADEPRGAITRLEYSVSAQSSK